MSKQRKEKERKELTDLIRTIKRERGARQSSEFSKTQLLRFFDYCLAPAIYTTPWAYVFTSKIPLNKSEFGSLIETIERLNCKSGWKKRPDFFKECASKFDKWVLDQTKGLYRAKPVFITKMEEWWEIVPEKVKYDPKFTLDPLSIERKPNYGNWFKIRKDYTLDYFHFTG